MKANISGLILNKSADHNEMNFRIPNLLSPLTKASERSSSLYPRQRLFQELFGTLPSNF